MTKRIKVYEYEAYGDHDARTHAEELREAKAYPLVMVRRHPRTGSFSVEGWTPIAAVLNKDEGDEE